MKELSYGAKKTLKYVMTAFMFVAAILLVVTAISNGKVTDENGKMFLVTDIANFIALFIAALYLLGGYRKSARGFFKAFLIVYALTRALIAVVSFSGNIHSMATSALCFIILVILLFTKDLGSRKSFIMGLIVFLLCVMNLVDNILFVKDMPAIINCCAEIVLSIILNLMILAKYDDKATRGTN